MIGRAFLKKKNDEGLDGLLEKMDRVLIGNSVKKQDQTTKLPGFRNELK